MATSTDHPCGSFATPGRLLRAPIPLRIRRATLSVSTTCSGAGSGIGLRTTPGPLSGNAEMIPPSGPTTTVIVTPSRTPVSIQRRCAPSKGASSKSTWSGRRATSRISATIRSSDQLAGNSVFPGLPVPGRCPPPVASPSRMCVRRSSERVIEPGSGGGGDFPASGSPGETACGPAKNTPSASTADLTMSPSEASDSLASTPAGSTASTPRFCSAAVSNACVSSSSLYRT